MTDQPMAILLLRETLPPPEVAAVMRGMRALAPSDVAMLRPAGRPGSWPVTLGLGAATFHAALLPAPLGGAEVLADAAYWWPGARAAVAAHRAQLAISVAPPPRAGDTAAMLTASRRVTRLVATLAELAGDGALGILWTGSGGLWPVPTFVAEARLPLALPVWMALQPRRGAERGAIGFATRGLRPFIGREIRFEPTTVLPPDDLARRCVALARQFLAGGEVREGVMILGPAERIRVRFAQDAELGGPVLALSAECLEIAR